MVKPKARFGKLHFVKWDNGEEGGIWMECSIGQRYIDGSYDVTTHIGDRGNYLASEISRLGITSEVGDIVISYFDEDSSYAVKGKHTKGDEYGRIFVEFGNGKEDWIEAGKVHKLVTL